MVSAHHPWELSLAVQTMINLCVPLPPLLCTKLLLELQSIWFLPQSILISAGTQLKERKTHRNYQCWFTVNQPQSERWWNLHSKNCSAVTSEELSGTKIDQETYQRSWEAGEKNTCHAENYVFLQNRQQIKEEIILGVIFLTALQKSKISTADELGHYMYLQFRNTRLNHLGSTSIS